MHHDTNRDEEYCLLFRLDITVFEGLLLDELSRPQARILLSLYLVTVTLRVHSHHIGKKHLLDDSSCVGGRKINMTRDKD